MCKTWAVLLVVAVAGASALFLPEGKLVHRFKRQLNKEDPKLKDLRKICETLPRGDFFRRDKWDDGDDCRTGMKCDFYDQTGQVELHSFRCPQGLVFNIDKQACDWKKNVEVEVNCNKLTRDFKPRPLFHTEEPICEGNKLACGDGQCIEKRFFCDGKPDCDDSSDENSCTVDENPNAAPECNLEECQLPKCFCSPDGTQIPGKIEPSQVPQMVTITFSGAVNFDNIDLYDEIFNGERQNPNGCTIRGTFFTSHKYTNYSAIQELHRKGHEIAAFSITSDKRAEYWSGGDFDTWFAEMDGERYILQQFANITPGDIVGMRAPYLRVGGNPQFAMMENRGFLYDASITVPLSRVPVWPYTLHYRLPHKCSGNHNGCPSNSYDVWEMVMNELDRREDPEFDEALPGCHFVDSCTNIQSGKQFAKILRYNFQRHLNSNRAPLGLHFHAAWLESKKEYKRELIKFIEELLDRNDVYFVTMRNVIQWMQEPTELTAMRDFQTWKERCDIKGQPYCSLPNACPLHTRELPGETIRLHTCMECPKFYPWIANPFGTEEDELYYGDYDGNYDYPNIYEDAS